MLADTLRELSLSLDRALIIKTRDLAVLSVRITRW
jgi:ABC-type phosphonate transport system ATPase subunit